MERDASLDDFLDTDPGDDDESGGKSQSDEARDNAAETSDEAASEATDAETAPEGSTVEPARSTGRWDPEGAVCDACGASVTRRWREGGEAETFVCAECKSW